MKMFKDDNNSSIKIIEYLGWGEEISQKTWKNSVYNISKLKETYMNEMIYMCLWIVSMSVPQTDSRFTAILIKNLAGFCWEIDMLILKQECKCRVSRIMRSDSEDNKVGGFTWSDTKSYYNVVVIECSGGLSMKRDPWNIIASPEIDLFICDHLIYWQSITEIQCGEK